MEQKIRTIGLSGVNCYLVEVEAGARYALIDTGLPNRRADLDRALESAGCKVRGLKLILLTHGDYDHAGNAAYLRARHGAVITMHEADAGRVERGDWGFGLKPRPDRFAMPFRLVSLFVRPGSFETFRPDVCLEDGQDLSAFGLRARILHLPGHTRGSIGVLTEDGDLFCGDLLDSIRGKPELQFFIDDLPAASASLERLRSLSVGTVYPGHGKPFPMAAVPQARAGRRG